MILATQNCGCPTKQSTGLPHCSICCPRSGINLQKQACQHFTQLSKPICPIAKEKAFCCINCQKLCLSSTLLQRSNCCAKSASRMHSGVSFGSIHNISAHISEKSLRKKCSNSASELKDEVLKCSNINCTSTDNIVSEIIKKKQPYKEIEAIINNNRVIVRTHKESLKDEYNPPCECIDQDTTVKESESELTKCDRNAVFEMADGNLELYRTPGEALSTTKQIDDEEDGIACRTMTLYPHAGVEDRDGTKDERKEKKKKDKRAKALAKSIETEENPNIFVLRIRKKCESGDEKYKVDLEFRTPRPWPSPKEEEKKLSSNPSPECETEETKKENNVEKQIL